MDDVRSDRSAGLILFGAVQILAGIACGLMLLGVVAGATTAATASGVFVFGIAAFHFITSGVGSIKGRRWARALSLVVGALWFVAGVISTIATVIVSPRIGAPYDGRAIAILAASIVIPAALVLFYRRDDVRLTCERRDPKRRWTDRVPAPVLALVIVMAFATAWLLVNLSRPAVPLFGTVLTGATASLTLLALAVLCATLAVHLYRLKESAWWMVVLLQVIGCAVAGASMVRSGDTLYRDPAVLTLVLASWIGYFAFLVSLRRYFVAAARESDTAAVVVTS